MQASGALVCIFGVCIFDSWGLAFVGHWLALSRCVSSGSGAGQQDLLYRSHLERVVDAHLKRFGTGGSFESSHYTFRWRSWLSRRSGFFRPGRCCIRRTDRSIGAHDRHITRFGGQFF